MSGPPPPIEVDPALVDRLTAARVDLLDRVRAAGGSVGPGGVRVVAVTKTHPPEVAAAAFRAGFEELGENYAQEMAVKADAVPGAVWHFVGGLQTNKVRKLVGRVQCVQSVDRPSLVAEMARRLPDVDVLVQVNLSGDPGRAGVPPAGAPTLIDAGREAGLRVMGVMGVAPLGSEVEVARSFAELRRLADSESLDIVSMGMSGDLEIAIAEGSTMIRIGSALFGPRPT